jgi:hypothetical protein
MEESVERKQGIAVRKNMQYTEEERVRVGCSEEDYSANQTKNTKALMKYQYLTLIF